MSAVALVALLIAFIIQSPTCAADGYHCLDYYAPVGDVLHEISFPEQHLTSTAANQTSSPELHLTSGQLARDCNSYCTAEPDCTAAWSVSAVTTAGPTCKLLRHTADDVAALLRPAAGKPYPIVQPSFIAVNGSREKSLSWLCLKNQQDWDELGAVTYRTIRPSAAGPGWCAYATDAAGNNLIDNWQGSGSLTACADSCDASSQCSFWVGRPGHCWLKYSALVGADGWTAAYRPAWLDVAVQPNAAVTCFKQLQDWRELGQQLNPNVATVQYDGLWYTLFPERVNHTEAAAACARLPQGRLAQLDTQAALTAVGNALLPTLPMQYTVQVAWVGARGILDDSTASVLAGDMSQVPQLTATDSSTAAAPGTAAPVPTWQGSSKAVNLSLYTHPSEHYLQWRGSDRSFREYVPIEGKPVCVAAMGVPPPPVASAVAGSHARGQSEPGLYLFTCRRPTAYICESSSIPASLAKDVGRVVPKAAMLYHSDPSSARSGLSREALAAVVLLPTLALLALAVASCACATHIRWLMRALSMQRKRALGLPSKGTLTVAVTDIQGYTKLSEDHPQAMGQALLLHNQAIREAVYINAGHVLAQEGDSFIVGFSDPLDAAVFALQVQHQMMQLEVPPELQYDDDNLPLAWQTQHIANSHSKQAQHKQHQKLSPSIRTQSALPVLRGAVEDPAVGDARLNMAMCQRSRSSSLQGEQPWHSGFSALLCPWSPNAKHSGSATPSGASCTDPPQHSPVSWDAPRKANGATHGLSSSARRPSSIGRWLSSSAAGSLWRALLSPQGSAGQPGLFKGLRVRVGLATGSTSKGQAVETTMAYSMARVISECGAGGQVLTDAATFQAIRSQLHLLGAVTASGLDYGRVEARHRRAAGPSCLQKCGSASQAGRQQSARDAVVLDMGLYETPLCMLPSAATNTTVVSTHPSLIVRATHSVSTNHSTPPLQEDACVVAVLDQHAQPPQAWQSQRQGPWARSLSMLSSVSAHALGTVPSSRTQTSVSAVSTDSRAGACCGQVRLYQLLAPELVGRAVLFGNKLAVCDTWRCLDPPYFAAPGLCEAQFASDGLAQRPSTPGAAGGHEPPEPTVRSITSASPRPARVSPAGLAGSPGATLAALRALSMNAAPPAGDASVHNGSDRLASSPCFPPVSVVFVAVEGSERVHQLQHTGVGHLHGLLSRLMLEACALLHGYLVKTYEVELKYMAVFSSPAAAVKWCLVLQEAALHLPYPDNLLQHHGFRTKCDAGGQLLCRGPRLKMGVAEGPPTCIVPDHLGRADYLGPVVNQAARVCDAAAHGGQIALQQGLGMKVLQHWRSQEMQPNARHRTPLDAAAAADCLQQPAADTACDTPPSHLVSKVTEAVAEAVDMSSSHDAVEVVMQHLGSFLFKGCAKSMQVVNFTTQKLAGRKYPAQPPQGKGVRLAQSSGTFEVAAVCLPHHVVGLDLCL